MKNDATQSEKIIRNHFYDLIDALSTVRLLTLLEVHRLTEEEIVEAVLNILIEHQDMEYCSLFLVKEGILEYAGGKDWDDYFGDVDISVPLPPERLTKVCEIREKLMREAVRTKMLQYCSDCTKKFHHEDAEPEADGDKLRSLISIPIIASDKVLGVINVFRDHPNLLQTWQEHVLTLFCSVLGNTLENHRVLQSLNNDIEARNVELRAASVRLQQESQERMTINSKAAHLAHFDVLTGLPNRRSLIGRLEKNLVHSIRNNIHGALLYLDLDHFKTINKSVGHAVGDMLLRQLAERLLLSIRDEDSVAYLGGDEFAILLQQLGREPGKADAEARMVAKTIQEVVAEPYRIQGHEYQSTVSIGVVLFPTAEDGAYDILKHGESAMHMAKGDRQFAVQSYRPSMQVSADERLHLEKDLRLALKRQEFLLYYQPQVDHVGRIIGAEALLRWNHPKNGIITPDQFLSVAEETGLINPLGEWVLRKASVHYSSWTKSRAVKCPASLSINVSPQQLHQAGFCDQLRSIILESGMEPANLTLEVTEGALIGDMEDTIQKMCSLKALGVKFSIDDFGTGYSSLAYINKLPLDELKIDKLFVWEINENSKNIAIVDSIITMSELFGLEVVAEGVETLEQLNLLVEKGCERFQGYYFSQSLPEEDFKKLLGKRI